MSVPGTISRVIRHVKTKDVCIDNDQLISLCGGNDGDWGKYLKGPRAQAIIQACNTHLKIDGYMLSCEKRGQGEWRLVTLSEGHLREAIFNLDRIDGAYKRAYDAVLAISTDINAPKSIRTEAEAWLQLFDEPRSEKGLTIMRQFAGEILALAPAHHHNLKLVEVKK